jgi:chymotrypsin/suppressor of tumorigenicity protein 14
MTRRISKIFLHRQYNAATYVSCHNSTKIFFITIHFFFDYQANDIAIIVMDAPVVLSRSVAPVCLPAAATDIDTFNDQDAIILGWGGGNINAVDQSVSPFDNLQQAKVSIQSNTDCKSVGDLSRFVSDSTICVTSTADDKFTCTVSKNSAIKFNCLRENTKCGSIIA